MTSKPVMCSRCGCKILNGLSYTHDGKAFCYSCFKQVQTDLLSLETEQQALYQYIKQLFSVSEIPSNVLNAIKKEISTGKKYRGIKLTLYYYYEVLEHSKNNIDSIIFVIRDQYENARKYRDEVNTLKEINEQVNLDIPARTITIPIKQLQEDHSYRRKKKKYDISDL